MKSRKFGKRLIALGLSAIMIVGLSACGGKKDSNPNGELAKQFVYSYEKIDVPNDGDDFSIRSVIYLNDRVYMLADVYYYNWDTDVPSYDDQVMPLSAITKPEDDEADGDAADGDAADGDVDTDGDAADGDDADDEDVVDEDITGDVDVDVWDNGKYEPNDYIGPTEVLRLINFNLDGSDMQTVDLDAESSYTGNFWYNWMSIGQDGNVYGIKQSSYFNDSDPENAYWEESMELICWSRTDGSMKWSVSLDGIAGPEEYIYVDSMAADTEGMVYLFMGGSVYKTLTVDANGTMSQPKDMDSEVFMNSRQSFLNQDGTMAMLTYNDDWTKMFYSTFDLKTGESSEKIELPDTIASFYNMYSGPDGRIMMTNSNGIFTWNKEANTIDQVMSYVNSDLNTNSLNSVCFIDEEHFIASYNNENWETEVSLFTKVAPEDIPDKTVLVLGCNYLGSDYRKRVVEFNKSSDKYRITIKDYSQYQTMDDYMAGYTQLNNDIISGNMPDILLTDDYSMPIDNYIAKGLIADIGKLLEKDEELSQVEFMQNVFEAYSVDGTLYYVVPYFTITTVLGKTSVVGDRIGWNMEEFHELIDNQPEGTSAFGEMTQSGFLYTAMQYGGTEYIDQSTGKCHFDSDEFINLLEYAKTLPKEIVYDDSYYENYDWTLYETQYRDNRTLLMTSSIYDFSSMKRYAYGNFGEEVSFIGFPTEDKNGSIVNGSNTMVLSAKSTDLDGAWEFARYYLCDEFQQRMVDDGWGFPVNKSKLRTMAEAAMERPHWEYEDGTIEYYDYTWWIGDEQVVIPPMTEEEMEKALSFVESVNRRYFYNNDILSIIQEEAEPFFDGQKSAAEVAGVIQSRVQLLVNESR